LGAYASKKTAFLEELHQRVGCVAEDKLSQCLFLLFERVNNRTADVKNAEKQFRSASTGVLER
jgi:hypothetical protein